MARVSNKDQKEINEVILRLWAAADQAQIMDLVEFAFTNLPYKLKKDVLKDLMGYVADKGNRSGILSDDEVKEWIEHAKQII